MPHSDLAETRETTMTISDRISRFFHSGSSSAKRKTKADRNAKLVQFFYGVLDSEQSDATVPAWPTLEDTGRLWGGMTRERARQIIHHNFVSKIDCAQFPELAQAVKVLKSRTFWTFSELSQELLEQRVVCPSFSLKGLFNLMDDLGFEHGFQMLTPELSKVSRANYSGFSELFIIHRSILLKVHDAYKKIRHIAPRCGVAQISYTCDPHAEPDLYRLLIKLLSVHPGVWFHEVKNKVGTPTYWYAFENMNNTLVSYAEKVFHILKPVNSARCAEVFHNALRSRSYDYPYPTVDIIELFLQNCRHFKFDQATRVLTFIGREMPVTSIEMAIVRYLSRHEKVNFHDFLEHLSHLSYGLPLAKKNITFSPFILVDREHGRKSHTYELLSPVKENFC